MLGPNGANTSWSRTPGDPRPITQGHRFDCDRDVTEQVLTPLYVKTVVQAAKSAAWRAR